MKLLGACIDKLPAGHSGICVLVDFNSRQAAQRVTVERLEPLVASLLLGAHVSEIFRDSGGISILVIRQDMEFANLTETQLITKANKVFEALQMLVGQADG